MSLYKCPECKKTIKITAPLGIWSEEIVKCPLCKCDNKFNDWEKISREEK